jgi:hypothetical protein
MQSAPAAGGRGSGRYLLRRIRPLPVVHTCGLGIWLFEWGFFAWDILAVREAKRFKFT